MEQHLHHAIDLGRLISLDIGGELEDGLVERSPAGTEQGANHVHRTAVVLSDVQGLRYAEIAQILDIPEGTVKSRLFRGRRILQKKLREYAYEMGYIKRTAA